MRNKDVLSATREALSQIDDLLLEVSQTNNAVKVTRLLESAAPACSGEVAKWVPEELGMSQEQYFALLDVWAEDGCDPTRCGAFQDRELLGFSIFFHISDNNWDAAQYQRAVTGMEPKVPDAYGSASELLSTVVRRREGLSLGG